mmetsp:Transcript_128164/g.255950  ORF Transcript_128164/g.255950 Transcript_128164/m.255950 type:complete len:194 (+) Transcript_128164:136-717(+)
MLPFVTPEFVPTDYALRMRPYFLAMLVALSLLIAGKFIIHDFWGGVNLLFVVLMGLFVLSGPNSISAGHAPFFCIMATISGIFDTISCFVYFHHSSYEIFDEKAPRIVILAQIVFLVSPVLLLAASALGYSIYIDCRQNNPDETFPLAAAYEPDMRPAQNLYQPPRYQQQQPHPGPRVPQPFQGHGQRLGQTT